MRACVAAAAAADAGAGAPLLRTIAQRVASKQQSAVEVTQAYLQQLRSVEGQVGAFLAVDEAAALAQVCAGGGGWSGLARPLPAQLQRAAGMPTRRPPACTRTRRRLPSTPPSRAASPPARWRACPSRSR